MMGDRRRGTTTSGFGVSKRESHDASGFYSRFTPPLLNDDAHVESPVVLDEIFQGDARQMSAAQVRPGSVALVVTSPPYFAGKEYEQDLGSGHVPSSYLEYLDMLRAVFARCVEALEPGGRIAVNVANLGRRPYRSLSADVIDILQNDLQLLLRGEIIWQKARGAGGSCAWGSFQSPANPVLRDITERVVIASKGRFDRALSAQQRHARGLPSNASLFKDEFMDATLDLWELEPESASRVGHPAPFPIALPERLIDLYTYEGDLVLDPFMGSGTTAVAAIRTSRHFVGFDTDPGYVERAQRRVAEERERLEQRRVVRIDMRPSIPAIPLPADEEEDFQARAVREGRKASELAALILEQAGFSEIRSNVKLPTAGAEVNFSARDALGALWLFDVSGAFTSGRPGLRRTDTVWKAIGKAAAIRAVAQVDQRLVLLSTNAPARNSAGYRALQAVCGPSKPIHDVIEFLSAEGFSRLRELATARAR